MDVIGRPLKILLLILIVVFLGVFKAEIGLCQGCSMNATPINFGNYDVFSSTPLDAIGTITVNCSGYVGRATVTLSQGSYGTFSPRRMKRSGGADLLDYNVYTNATRTAIFGDGTGGTSRILPRRPPGPRVPWSASINMYGRIPAGQNVSVGTYSDTLTATVTP
jgi:spore coat protein U-like protein